ncbi:MAG: hypothetical protein V1495_03485 [Pseudomonadota bacterium]
MKIGELLIEAGLLNADQLASPITPRMAVYVVRKDQIGGYAVRGFPVHNREFAEMKLPVGSQSVICRVVESSADFRGLYQPTPDEERIFGVLSIPTGTKIELHPIRVHGKTVAAFLGLPATEKGLTKPEAGNRITLVCGKAGLALEMLSTRNKIAQLPE